MGRTKKNEFGSSWWAQKWNSVLDRFGWSGRMQRGRSYARSGHVLDFMLKPGLIEAKVKGSRPRPYKVKIEMNTLSFREWKTVIEKMSEKAIFSAKLLAGEMPENIEEAFSLASVSLFPESSNSIRTNCSCPDYANPCKHIAAVYYILGQEFDKDPFMIFRLRGMDKEQLMEELRKARGTAENSTQEALINNRETSGIEVILEEMKNFKDLDDAVTNMTFSFLPPRVSYSVMKRLGTPPFFKEKESFERLMTLYCDKAAEKVRELLEMSAD